MSRAPYFDALGVKVDAALADTVDGVLDVALDVVLEPADVAVVLPADPEPVAFDKVVEAAAVEFALLVPAADDEVTVALLLDEDPVELWAKTAPDEEDLMLDVTEDATLEPADEETALPLQEPEILMLW